MDGDEVWSGSDSDVESDHVATPRAGQAQDRPRLAPSGPVQPLVKPPEKMIAAPLPEVRVRSSVLPSQPAVGTAKKPVAAVTAPPSQQRGLVGLLGHLRQDNDRLREALLAAQKEAETMQERRAEEAEGEAENNIDFGQLLALVKDFGDGLGGFEDSGAGAGSDGDWWGGPEADEGAGAISMATPRGSEDGDADEKAVASADAEAEEEVIRLRQELESSRLEAQHLRQELELRDAELAALQSGANSDS